MDITRININLVDGGGNVIAHCTITISDALKVRGIRVIRTQEGKLLVVMPSRERSSGEFVDIVHPIHSSARQRLESAILSRLKQVQQGNGTTRDSGTFPGRPSAGAPPAPNAGRAQGA